MKHTVSVTDALWSAVADPRRRALLDVLRERPRAVGELVGVLGLTQPATSKHLRVLREAGLVRVRTDAQRRIYAVDLGGVAELDRWLAPYRRLWNGRLDALGRHLDRRPGGVRTTPTSRRRADGPRYLRRARGPSGRALRALLPASGGAGVGGADRARGAGPLVPRLGADGAARRRNGDVRRRPARRPSTGTVLVFDPPRRLAYTWGRDELHFDLEAAGRSLHADPGQRARRRATRRPATPPAGRSASPSWTSTSPGRSPTGPTAPPPLAWQPLYDAYVAEGMPAGAAIPTAS